MRSGGSGRRGGDLAQPATSMLQIATEAHPQPSAGLLQTGRRVPAVTGPASFHLPALSLRRLTSSRMFDSRAMLCGGTSRRSSTASRKGFRRFLMWKRTMPFANSGSFARVRRFASIDFCTRLDGYLNWLGRPLVALIQATIAATLCGLFLHPQGFLLAFGLGAVLAVGVVWPWLSLCGLTGSLSFDKRRTREGEPIKILLAISNRCPWGAWGLAVDAGFGQRPTPGSPGPPDVGLSLAAGWGTTESSWDFVPECRGEYPSRRPLIATGFPFGLWTVRRELTNRQTLLVWPRTFPVGPIPEAIEGESADGLAPRDKPGTWGDLLGVRPYRRGDSLRRIHWPQTARHGQLVVCEVQASAVPRVQIVLDASPASHVGSGPDSSREWAIRIVASFAEGWIHQGARVEMIVDARPVISSGGSARAQSASVLDALARLAPGDGRSLADLLNLPECRHLRRGLRVVVTTDMALRRLSADDLRRPGTRFVVLESEAFERESGNRRAAPLPVVPWLWIDGPTRVAACLRRSGKEVAVGG